MFIVHSQSKSKANLKSHSSWVFSFSLGNFNHFADNRPLLWLLALSASFSTSGHFHRSGLLFKLLLLSLSLSLLFFLESYGSSSLHPPPYTHLTFLTNPYFFHINITYRFLTKYYIKILLISLSHIDLFFLKWISNPLKICIFQRSQIIFWGNFRKIFTTIFYFVCYCIFAREVQSMTYMMDDFYSELASLKSYGWIEQNAHNYDTLRYF
jgi:hypothetical protein